MARYTGPVCRMCRADGKKLMLKGTRCMSDKCPMNKKRGAPGKDPKVRAGKRSEYGLQLIEKQKIRRMYGMLEKQFRLTFDRALRMPGVTGENFIQLLERRLDNVVYRMHYAVSRNQARQLVLHGHVLVNGKSVNIPSYEVKVGDVIEIKEKSKKLPVVQDALGEVSKSGTMPWVTVDVDAVKGTFAALPRREEVTDLLDVKEQLVVEFYSK
ncbi:MAG: 30S ribosomal protein S4 [Treponema porcinum]|uniref:30S ribosomal protein S4 n=1 Tax=Treponema porcinum TaxID=261392 RepID=UPI002352ED07|nr:30S ribosomal protein S4 [Treponema porcinum]MCI5645876.1 30S ribosomal protein S4 [Treponema porcinum]MCI6321953.1 30S ribosomal protein S4 [Treponema porcinum]MCI6482024.1 30S ribosomal protein S4 [Treponema porcinum]MCI6721978.1 30S ribosomal protein S4 [Treponema porcinum]MCI6815595.1 30S ribosomal protein S4 [Treponema porcinum]